MNKYIKISFISLAAATLVTSCDLDVENPSSLKEPEVFSTYSTAEAAVMSIHQSFGETNSYRGRFLPYYGVSSDVETGGSTSPSLADATADKQSLWNYNTLSSNTQMNTSNNAYAKFYEAVERANYAIDGLRKYGDVENQPDMAYLLGEALTLRAVVYNDLVKAWGDVPLRLEPLTNDTKYQPRTNRDVIYKQLIADLFEAEDYCYWPNENTITETVERVNKAFVKGLRARLALYACGYGLRGDGFRRSYDPDLAPEKMYQIVKDECVDVIKHSKPLEQLPFKDNFLRLCQDNVEAGYESLFEIPFSDGRGRVLYTWGVRHRAADQYTAQAQGGVNGPLPYLWYDYDPEDIRRNITCVPYEWGDQLVDGHSHQQLTQNIHWAFGKLRYEWMTRKVTSTNDDGVNWQYMRLADVYLMAAEAINELEGPANAAQYMRPVLARVLPAAKVEALMAQYTASQEAFREGIYDQRALEFAGEALRKADLVRWGNIDEKMQEAKDKLTQMRDKTGKFENYPDKLYYKTVAEGETGSFDGENIVGESLIVYGLEEGETDDVGSDLTKDSGYESKGWFTSDGKPVITDDYINGLYVVDKPSLHCLWPIWDYFISTSNGQLNNDGNYGQLSD